MSEPFFDDDAEESSSSSHPGLAKSTVMAAMVAIVFVVAATFFGMQLSGAGKNIALLTTEIATISEEEEALTAELTALQRQHAELKGRTDVLYNGSFQVCNESNRDIRVAAVAATYLNQEGGFETFNSQPYGTRLWTIEPGQRKSLTFEQGNVAWDGSVTYYAALLRAADGQEYPYAGMWPPNDAGCMRWTVNFGQ